MGELKLLILDETIIQQGVKDKNKLFNISTHQMKTSIHRHFIYHSSIDI
jgi:hypothetical protein